MSSEKSKTYFVKRCNAAGGIMNHSFWISSNLLSDFSYPWENAVPADMEFRALHDDQWLYCFFRVRDKKVLTYMKESAKEEVLYGDRVEIFFAADRNLATYYCLEIDPDARVYDYHASHYRKFNAAWQWPERQLQITTERSENGYDVVAMIGMESLKKLGLLHHGSLQAGIFRGKCTEINLIEDRMRWISWIPPASSFPDFHIPSAFGTLILQ